MERCIRSVSLYQEDIDKLALIKKKEGIHLSGVVRVGIRHILEEKDIKKNQFEMEENNRKLVEKLQNYAKKLWELEKKLQ